MDSNTHSTSQSAGLAALAAELQELAAQDPEGLADGARAERVRRLRGLADRLEGLWLAELAAVDARGAAGAEQGHPGRLDRRLAARIGCGWGPGRPPVRCGPPGPCSVAL